MSSYETLIVNPRDHYLEIRFNRPHRLNAVVEQFYRELIDALKAAEADNSVRAVLLTGEGRAFCVGADLKEHAAGERTPFQRRQYLQLGNDVCETIFRLEKPVVAAVNGYALGAGAEMAIACDFVLMAEGAQLGLPEVSIGTFVGGGVTRFLPRLVGLSKARELMFLGERINGIEAERIGLVTRAVADEQLQAEAQTFITKLAGKAPLSMALAKKLLNTSDESSIDAQLTRELDGLFAVTFSQDWKEGVDAFAEKRSPNFKGC